MQRFPDSNLLDRRTLKHFTQSVTEMDRFVLKGMIRVFEDIVDYNRQF